MQPFRCFGASEISGSGGQGQCPGQFNYNSKHYTDLNSACEEVLSGISDLTQLGFITRAHQEKRRPNPFSPQEPAARNLRSDGPSTVLADCGVVAGHSVESNTSSRGFTEAEEPRNVHLHSFEAEDLYKEMCPHVCTVDKSPASDVT